MNFMRSSNRRRLLVHKEMEPVTLNENVDIILSPHFYTFLRETLALKFSYQAKHIAPSLFDDYLEDSFAYKFHAYRCEEGWCFFAYNLDLITQFLEEKGIPAHHIQKVYFAQELESSLTQPIKLGSHEALQSIEGIVTVIPLRLMSSEETYGRIELNETPLEHGLTLSTSFHSVIPFKYAVMFTTLLLLLGITLIVEGNRIKSSVVALEEKQLDLLAENPKLGSSMIRGSELKKYQPIDQKERFKRDTISDISKLLSQQSQLKSLLVEDKKVTAIIKAANGSTVKQIESRAKTANFKIKVDAETEITMEKSL